MAADFSDIMTSPISNQTTENNEIVSISESIPDLKCNQYIVENKTHIIYGGYEGIPENLLINFIGWIVSRLIHFKFKTRITK